MIVFSDSTSAVAVITEEAIKERSKHLGHRLNHIRRQIESGVINIVQVSISENL